MYVEHVTNQLDSLPAQPGFCMLAGACQDFFPHRGFSTSHGLANFFSSWRFYFSASQPDPPIVGASDIGHGFYWPETGDQAQESNLGPVKRSCCMVRGLNPGPTKTSCVRVAQKDAQIAHRLRTNKTQIVHSPRT